ncbi:SprT-like domain-containing protein [Verrucomicrobium sp. BvORR106]|uniref:SprT family zinc-dependent metalloprotease n=1 Tax=Verrucomicrobium sp. BvORR106 TaxID=1403819 RepID=UPI00056E7B22|nr:SprT-like domain-containing protein [Verrucomicrobium sp. BvORR106]
MIPKTAQRQMWFEFLEKLVTPASTAAGRAEEALEQCCDHGHAHAHDHESQGEGELGPDDMEPATASSSAARSLRGRDAKLEAESRQWLLGLGMAEGAGKVQVVWNAKLRSTAGYARWPQWLVELNPRLVDFEGQVDRTLKHELAHLIAYARAGRRRIEPHGLEWRQACADLGIPDESARHTLPLPRTKQQRKFVYACPVCQMKVERVKRFRRHTACLACCRKHNRGAFDLRFQFVLVQRKEPGDA